MTPDELMKVLLKSNKSTLDTISEKGGISLDSKSIADALSRIMACGAAIHEELWRMNEREDKKLADSLPKETVHDYKAHDGTMHTRVCSMFDIIVHFDLRKCDCGEQEDGS